MKKISFLILFSMCVSSPSFAEGPGWRDASKITRLVVVASDGINIRLEDQLQNCTSISGFGAAFASVHPDHPGLDRIYALLLAAYVAQDEVQLYFSDETCKVTEVVIGGEYNSN
ncbi:MAG: hypothetical protein NPIRA05_15380 [Nitrospirales bacterium]|nr:MAG: hypothetical protein NPIRA05_15380 [Nitrospirales bacterium]